MGAWNERRIYCFSPLRRIVVNGEFHVLSDSLVQDLLSPPPGYGLRYFQDIAVSAGGDKILLVMSLYRDVSVGELVSEHMDCIDVT